MIFIDTNIFMYAAGEEHPNKEPSIKVLDLIAMDEIQVAISVEVVQEILHRYTHLDKKSQGISLARKIVALVDRVYGVEPTDIEDTIEILDKYDVSSRDAIHIAVCENRDIDEICTYDRHFEKVNSLTVKKPEDLIKDLEV